MKLSNDIRGTILDRALKHGFDKPRDLLKRAEKAFGEMAYNDIYSKKVRDMMQALPADYLPVTSSVLCRFGATEGRALFEKPKRVPTKHDRYSAVAKIFSGDHKLTQQYLELSQQQKDLNTRYKETREQIKAILDSVTTLKRLQEIWPECEPFIKDMLITKKPALPAVPVKEVNKSLGLPV